MSQALKVFIARGPEDGPQLGLGTTGEVRMNWLTSTAAMLAIFATLIRPSLAEPIKSGLHSQTVIVRDTPIEVQTYRPLNCRVQGLLLAFHGSERNPRAARQAARPLADRGCLILLAPYFDNARFPLARY